MIEIITLGERTFHLRATMGALRAAKREHGISITSIGDDPLDAVTLCYHFARAGAKTQGQELTMTLDEFEDNITAGDLPIITAAMQRVMTVDTKKKGRR